MQRFRRIIPLVVLLTAACEDPFGPGNWDSTPDTVTLYSASRAEYAGFFSVLDITSVPVAALPLESPGFAGLWDIALLDTDGGLALAPNAALPGTDRRARISVVQDRAFDDITSAPRDTTQYTAEPVQVNVSDVYIVRSRRRSCSGVSGYNYAKLRPIAIDQVTGTMSFEIVRNPFCDNRSFVPPED